MPRFDNVDAMTLWTKLLNATSPGHTFMFGTEKFRVHMNANDQRRYATEEVLHEAA